MTGEKKIKCDISVSAVPISTLFKGKLNRDTPPSLVLTLSVECATSVLVSIAARDVRRRLGHVKVSSGGGGSRRVHSHTLGNTIARSDITSMKQVELRHSSIKTR